MALIILLALFLTILVTLAYAEGRFDGSTTRMDDSYISSEDRPVLNEWLPVWYEAAHSDIQWAKERAWAAVQSIAVAAAALAAAAEKDLFGKVPNGWLVGAIVIVGLVGIAYIYDLHCFAKKARVIADRILSDVPARSTYLGEPRQSDRHHVRYLLIKSVVIVAVCTAAIVTIL